MSYAPIALFAYNRPLHLRRVVDALLLNPEARQSELFIFCDGARSTGDAAKVDEVRSYARQISGFASIHRIEREQNYGLSRSLIEGISKICQDRGRVIVLEDDIVTPPYFLRFMNAGLDLYRDDERVASIHGYIYPIAGLPETFFLRGADCWGWATWKRGWDMFEANGSVLLDELESRKLTHRFDMDGAYPYTRMLKAQIAKRNDSWAIRWYASTFLRDKLTLYPGRSLVLNIGTDGSGTHYTTDMGLSGEVADAPISVGPLPVEENEVARRKIISFLKDAQPSLFKQLLHKLASVAGGVR
jgi:hypothetical protein